MQPIKPCGLQWESLRRNLGGKHFGIIKSFVRGRWLNPHVDFRGPGIFESQRFALHRLYDLRLKVDYRLEDIGQEEAQWAIQIAQEIIAIAEQKDARDAT